MIQGLFDHLPMLPRPPRALPGEDLTPDKKPSAITQPLLSIVIDGEPVPWGRAGARIVYPRGSKPFIHFYTPKETEHYETLIRNEAKLVMGCRTPFDQPIGLNITVYLPPLKSWSKKKLASALRAEILPAVRPDIDNYIKAALDAFNGVVYVDDGRITDMRISKRYSDQPRMEIEVYV